MAFYFLLFGAMRTLTAIIGDENLDASVPQSVNHGPHLISVVHTLLLDLPLNAKVDPTSHCNLRRLRSQPHRQHLPDGRRRPRVTPLPPLERTSQRVLHSRRTRHLPPVVSFHHHRRHVLCRHPNP